MCQVFVYACISCYDIFVKNESEESGRLLHTLADFRYELRRFLLFSESASQEAGLQPQQHQLLLQVAGASHEAPVTIAYAANRLGLKHNSTVKLVDRSEREDLIERTADKEDKRRAILRLTRKGRQVLQKLSGEHARELNEMAPRLVRALRRVQMHSSASVAEVL
jgi:DNA-binding MarR family transcriptional regulator